MRILQRLKKEFVHGIVIFLFFFITLNIITLTEGLLLKSAGIHFSFLEIFIAATLITKLILILDHLPIVQFLPARPIIFRILWKTVVYWIVTFTIRQLTQFFSYFKDSGWDWNFGWEGYLNHLNFNLIVAVHTWYLMLLILFITANELTFIIGSERMRKIFFGKAWK